ACDPVLDVDEEERPLTVGDAGQDTRRSHLAVPRARSLAVRDPGVQSGRVAAVGTGGERGSTAWRAVRVRPRHSAHLRAGHQQTRGPRALSGLFGVQTTPLNKKTMTNEEYRRLQELTDLATWLKARGVTLPSINYVSQKK